MPAKRKALSVAGVLVAGLLCLYACTSTSTSVSGQLSIVTFEGSSAGVEVLGDVPLSSIRLPKRIALEQGLRIAKPPVRTEAEFVPDEIIVQYRPGVDPLTVQGLTQAGGYRELRISPPFVGQSPADAGRGSAIEESGTPGGAASRVSGAMAVLRLPSLESERLSPAALKDRTLREIERLNSLPSVEFAQPNYLYRPAALPDDNFYNLQWHYPLIKLDLVWSESLVSGLQNVTVAVIDTGIARSNGTKSGSNHDDLGGGGVSPFVYEYDFISSSTRSLDGNGSDPDATDPGDNPDPDLASFHGTHVMGTIGAYTDNGPSSPKIGVAGIAGGADAGSSVKIMPLRALGYGGGTTADIVDAIKYAARIQNSTGALPSQAADIINLSLGSTTNDPALKSAVDAAYNNGNGVLIVAAAGNNGTPETFYPAGYDSVISVSAVDIGAEIASYSNFGGTIEVAAPGGSFSFDLNFDNYVDGVLSTFSEKLGANSYRMDLYAFQQGTSMAAPHVAGLAALIKANNPTFTAEQIRSRIQSNVIDLGSGGRDDFYGYGMINAYAAVNGGAGAGPVLFPFPKKLKLMGDNPYTTFTLKNINDSSDISINNITKEKNALWLSVSQTAGNADNNGLEITVSVDTTTYSQLKDGTTHTEMLNISSTAGVEHVYVLYNVNGFPKTGIYDIGKVYVVALDIEKLQTDEYITHYDVTSYGDLYRYRIGALPSGTYIIGASTDRNGDGIIFEDDDSYGFYLSLDQIISVEVSTGDNRTGIDFTVIENVPDPGS
jgi:serine protease